MFYTSKRHSFRNFLRNSNLKYYAAFILVFIAILTGIVLINKKVKSSNQNTTSRAETARVTESSVSDSVASESGYKLSVNAAIGQLTVYSYSQSTNDYTNIEKVMLCSVNKNLQVGEYHSDKNSFARTIWYNSEGNIYRYYSVFDENVSFHSLRYSIEKDKNSLDLAAYGNLGNETDNIGINLLVGDAKWIYENCSYDSVVNIYSDSSEYLSDSINNNISIPEGIKWDPTDNSSDSPWCQTLIKSLESSPVIKLPVGSNTSNLLPFATALDVNDKNVSSHIFITGTYDFNTPGSYTIIYNIADIKGNVLKSISSLTIEEEETTEETTTPLENESESSDN